MPKCRVYLFTYNRNELFKRAVQSLLTQTFSDWVCEVHNDNPLDDFPAAYINSLNDQRFVIKNHAVNLGPTVSFNLAYAGCAESYASILEDDNWWEPSFLEEMIAIMDENPLLTVAWSNMQIWQEQNDATWVNTQRKIWEVTANQTFFEPSFKQALGALHSNGAMIYRGADAGKYLIPEVSLFNAVELIRERTFEYPIYLNSKVLANYSFTLQTSQSQENIKWTSTQAMLLSSFILKSDDPENQFAQLLKFYRKQHPSPVAIFMIGIVHYIKIYRFLRYFNLNDWLKITKWYCVNIFKIGRFNKYLKNQLPTWRFLLERTHF